MVEKNTSFKYSQSSQLWDGQTLKSLKILSAFNLLTLYQKGDALSASYPCPLSSQDFLEHPVYRRLLEKKLAMQLWRI